MKVRKVRVIPLGSAALEKGSKRTATTAPGHSATVAPIPANGGDLSPYDSPDVM